MATERYRIGTMGWGYADWNGVFYPKGTSSRDTIVQYARAFDIVEIDSTFYGTPRALQVEHWRDMTPANFLFCPKVPRLITHDLGLRDAKEEMATFVHTMALLGEKRGPMLIQMPPTFTRADLPALQSFLPILRELNDPTARFAIEFRHRSLIGTDVSELLQQHGVVLANADYVGMPRRFEITGDFLYMRLIGRHGAYNHHSESQADRTPDLKRWADILRENENRFSTACIFCNNDYEGYSPTTVNRLKGLLNLPIIERPPDIQGSLF